MDKRVDISAQLGGNCKERDDLIVALERQKKALDDANKIGTDLVASMSELLGELRLYRTELKRNNSLLIENNETLAQNITNLDKLLDAAEAIRVFTELMTKESNPLLQELIKALYASVDNRR